MWQSWENKDSNSEQLDVFIPVYFLFNMHNYDNVVCIYSLIYVIVIMFFCSFDIEYNSHCYNYYK